MQNTLLKIKFIIFVPFQQNPVEWLVIIAFLNLHRNGYNSGINGRSPPRVRIRRFALLYTRIGAVFSQHDRCGHMIEFVSNYVCCWFACICVLRRGHQCIKILIIMILVEPCAAIDRTIFAGQPDDIYISITLVRLSQLRACYSYVLCVRNFKLWWNADGFWFLNQF